MITIYDCIWGINKQLIFLIKDTVFYDNWKIYTVEAWNNAVWYIENPDLMPG